MTTPVLEQSLQNLAKQEQLIKEAEAHLRVLESFGKADTLTLRNNLRQTIADTEKMRAAIVAEMSST